MRLNLSATKLPKAYQEKGVKAFIDRWKGAHGDEKGSSQSFLNELCDVLGIERPKPNDPGYCFEKRVATSEDAGQSSTKFIDFFKTGHFVLEAKQGGEKGKSVGTAVRGTYGWAREMEKAYLQAFKYANNLPEGRPPFLVTCDIGYCFELWTSFGGNYGGYAARRRLMLEELLDPEIFQLFVDMFTNPSAQDPSKVAAKVTKEVAGRLAVLAKSMEGQHPPERVAKFLIRCLFTMFVEDIGLLPDHLFSKALSEVWLKDPKVFVPGVQDLWAAMNTGERFGLVGKLLKFNGGLFARARALPMTSEQLELLAEAAKSDWSQVEPSIFGTLLERALVSEERHKLGAHYTPRAYIERLVSVVVDEPLRDEWVALQAEIEGLMQALEAKEYPSKDEQKTARLKAQLVAIEKLQAFHRRLVQVKVLDPACGSGNFLYVTLDLMKRLELEVLQRLQDLGFKQLKMEMDQVTVNPAQFYGIEVKPWAREIAEMVIWIGYLQWHHRIQGTKPPLEPVLKDLHNIECRDALIEWDETEPDLDPKTGKVRTRWDGKTYKTHSATGELVPDETALIESQRYLNPRPAKWPKADFIVGNPPFIGTGVMRRLLGDGYVDAVRGTYKSQVPESADFVMFWWHKAAEVARAGKTKRFGFITTNSLSQTFNRRVIEQHLATKPALKLLWAIPDHPWVDSSDGAAVRISMTCGGAKKPQEVARLVKVVSEWDQNDDALAVDFQETTVSELHADLTAGAKVIAAEALKANGGLSSPGVKLHGSGFILTREEASAWGYDPADPGSRALARVIKPYLNGKDLMATSRDAMVIDFFGMGQEEAVLFSQPFQRVVDRVKPERDTNNRECYREKWWIFGEPRKDLRPALIGLPRYIATVETAKHRVFVFLDGQVLPDNMLVAIALDDPFHLGVLSSRVHVTWALAAGGRLGVGNDPRYNKTKCFDLFPFPVPSLELRDRIRSLGERLDAFRKERQAVQPDLTLTGMYNLLEKLRKDEPFTDKEKALHEKALTSILKQLHDDLDAAVFDAYGWPQGISDEEILERLVALNAERVEEEAAGLVRHLRPDYQLAAKPGETEEQPVQEALIVVPKAKKAKAVKKVEEMVEKALWPSEAIDQITAIRNLLRSADKAWSVDEVQARFKASRKETIRQRLEALVGLGVLELRKVDAQDLWAAR